MKGLKILLGAIYAVLIILILLSLKKCDKNHEHTSNENNDSVKTEIPVIDTPNTDTIVETTEDTNAVDRAREIGGFGALKVTLLWDFKADIDLHVFEPNGFHICYNRKKDASTGGELDQDNRSGGPGSAENIYWTEPPSGTYNVYLKYYAKNGMNTNSGECTVVIFREGQETEVRKVMMHQVGQEEHITTFTI